MCNKIYIVFRTVVLASPCLSICFASQSQSLALRPQIQGILNKGRVVNYGPGSPWEVKWGYYGDIRLGLEYTTLKANKLELSVASFSPTLKISTPGTVSTKGVNVLAIGAEYSLLLSNPSKSQHRWFAKAGVKMLYNQHANHFGKSFSSGGTFDNEGFMIDSITGYSENHTIAFPIGMQWQMRNRKHKEVIQFEFVMNLPIPIGNAAVSTHTIHYNKLQQPGLDYTARGIIYPTSFQLGISKSITLWQRK